MYELVEVQEEDRRVRDGATEEGRDSEYDKPRPGTPGFEKGGKVLCEKACG